jgi:hypothetical protein
VTPPPAEETLFWSHRDTSASGGEFSFAASGGYFAFYVHPPAGELPLCPPLAGD